MRDYKLYIYLAYAVMLFILSGIIGNAIVNFDDINIRKPQSVELRLGKQLID